MRSLVTMFSNSLLHFLFVSLFGEGILKMLSSLFLLDVGHPKMEQLAPGIVQNCDVLSLTYLTSNRKHGEHARCVELVHLRRSGLE